jgi:hypothetical protein
MRYIYVTGLLCVKTLLLNKKHAVADKVIAKLEIFPFEGVNYPEGKLIDHYPNKSGKAQIVR